MGVTCRWAQQLAKDSADLRQRKRANAQAVNSGAMLAPVRSGLPLVTRVVRFRRARGPTPAEWSGRRRR